jgi:hypothetical protein
MKLVLQQLPSTLRGTARMKLLAPDAAESLLKLEKDTGGLVYADMWRDAVSSLLAKRTRRATQIPGYSSHNYGMGLDLDVKTILSEKKIRYEDLLHVMKKRGWYCHRRDGLDGQVDSDHFNFLGDAANQYLVKCTQDPITWDNAIEQRIFDKYQNDFQLSTKQAQELLAKIGFYAGESSGAGDLYTREAVMAFQRAWDLIENGLTDTTLCRVLAFVTAEKEFRPQKVAAS